MKNILSVSIIICSIFSILSASDIDNTTSNNENSISRIEELEYTSIIDGTFELQGNSEGKATLELEDNTMKITQTGVMKLNEYSIINLKNGSLFIEGKLQFEKTDKDSKEKMIINLGKNGTMTIAYTKQIDELFAQININGGQLNVIKSCLNISDDIIINNDGKIFVDESVFDLGPNTNFHIKQGQLNILSSIFSIGSQSNMTISEESSININNSKLNNKGRLDSSTQKMFLTKNAQLNINEERFVMRDYSKLILRDGASINVLPEGKAFINKGSEIILADNTYLQINYGGLFILDDAKIVKDTQYNEEDKGGNISIVGCNIDPNTTNSKVSTALFLRKTSDDKSAQIICNKLDLGFNPKVFRGADNTSVETQTFITGK